MIIKGLKNIVAHREDEHDKNIEEWYARRGLPSAMERAVRREYRRRNPHTSDDRDYGNHEDWQDHPDAVYGRPY